MPLFNSSVKISQLTHPYTGEVIRAGSDYYADVGRGLFAPEIFLSFFSAFKTTVTNVEQVIAPITWAADAYPWATADFRARIKAGGDPADDTAGTGAQLVLLDVLDDTLNSHLYALPTAGASASASTSSGNSLTEGDGLIRRINGAAVLAGGLYRPAGSNVTDITIETEGGVAVSLIPARTGVSAQAVTTVPAGYTAVAVQTDISIDSSKPLALRGYLGFDALQTSAPFGAVIQIENRPDSAGGQVINFLKGLAPAPAGTDSWFTAQANQGNSKIALRVVFVNFLDPT